MCWRWILGVYPAFACAGITVPLLQRVTFSDAGMPDHQKVTKCFAPPYGSSLRLGLPSLRRCSGGRRKGPSLAPCGLLGILASLPPAQRLRSAFWKRGLAVIRQSIHSKSQQQIKISVGANSFAKAAYLTRRHQLQHTNRNPVCCATARRRRRGDISLSAAPVVEPQH
jgi:hypothetical protein